MCRLLSANERSQVMVVASFFAHDAESCDTPLFAFAGNFEINDLRGATDGDDVKRTVLGGDATFKYRGVSAMAEYFHKKVEPEIASDLASRTAKRTLASLWLSKRWTSWAVSLRLASFAGSSHTRSANLRSPKMRTSPSSGTDAPVTRLTSSSPAPASSPPIDTRSPASIERSRMRSGRRPLYCLITPRISSTGTPDVIA